MFWKDKKVLVTGASGFIGFNLAAQLFDRGALVDFTIHKTPLPMPLPLKGECIAADLTIMSHCERAIQDSDADYAFMCAANTSGAAVMRNTPLAHVTPNIVMNTQMLDAAYHGGVKHFIFVSSSAAYPDTGIEAAREQDFFNGEPHPVYHLVGWMKRYTEILCKSYARHVVDPMRMTVIRPSNVYGPWDKFDPQHSHMTAAMVRKVAERQDPIVVWGTGEDVRDLIYIDDFIRGVLLATKNTANYFAVNICSGDSYTVNDVLRTLLDIEDYDPEIIYDESKPSTIPVRRVSHYLAESLMGFKSTTNLREGLEKTLRWYRKWMQ